MHRSALFLLDFVSSKTEQQRRRPLQSKLGPESDLFYFSSFAVSRARFPMITGVASPLRFHPNLRLSNLGTSGKLNLSRSLPSVNQICREQGFKICAEIIQQ
jgi:hypothetical protein